MRCAVIFGGTGFIGSFFADFVLSNNHFDKVYLYDLESVEEKPFPYRHRLLAQHGSKIEFVRGDVRKPIAFSPNEQVALAVNFAAVHREPGHQEKEYFETNLYGAENVTDWARRVNCVDVIFTSSISPYGVSEEEKDESTLPVPVTAYGASKLCAEKIHIAWQNEDPHVRRLVIARPGVVFGPGEGGNVTRLVRAVRKGYFFYMGNRATRKAGIYVKELCNAIWWVYEHELVSGGGVVLFNGSMNPGPSIEEYVEAVRDVSRTRRIVLSVPYAVLLCAAYAIELIAKPLGVAHPFSPVRVRKLVRSNNILPKFLTSRGYVYRYSLREALHDWKRYAPEEWP